MSDDLEQRAEAWLAPDENGRPPEGPRALIRDLLAALRDQDAGFKQYARENNALLKEARRERDAARAEAAASLNCEDIRELTWLRHRWQSGEGCDGCKQRAERAEADLATAEGLLRACDSSGCLMELHADVRAFLARRDGEGAPS